MSVSLTNEQQQLVNAVEDTYLLLQKTQANLKKCPKQRLTTGYIEAKLLCLEGYWRTFSTAHQELVKLTPKGKRNEIPYFANEYYFVVEDLYICLQGDLKDMLLSMPNTSSNQTSIHKAINPLNVKLPRIELPTFSGRYEDWPTFRDMFISLIHNNTSLCNVQKLHYLKLSLVDEPNTLLKHVIVIDDNYEQAWNILTQRYGNKRMIINSLLQKLFNQKKISTPSAAQIKNLLDTTSQCLSNLKNQELPVESWDQLIIHLVVQRLDVDTHTAWEEESYKEKADELPTWDELMSFLETKYRSLEMVNPGVKREQTSVKTKSFHATSTQENTAITRNKSCSMCNAEHALCHCKDFGKLQPNERSDFIKKSNLCFNCLMPGHTVMKCRNRMSCRRCNRRHHTLLHHTSGGPSDNVKTHHNQIVEDKANIEYEEEPQTTISTHFVSERSMALLATALVRVTDEQGHSTILRALVDQGSQANFVSERAAQLMKAKRSCLKGTITGVGSARTTVNHMVHIELHSRHDDDFKLAIKAYVMPTRLTSHLPSKTITGNIYTWPHLRELTLADPSFYSPGRIDILLGVEVCAKILKPEIINGPPGSPCAQNTSLGWILFGMIQAQPSEEHILVMHHELNLDDMLKTMWEIEIDTKKKLTEDEEKCETIYRETYTRNEEGRYIVKLPFKVKNPQSPYGNTREGAVQRLHHLERRFTKNEDLRKEYAKAINEYCEMNHMEEVPLNELSKPAVYLPHHAVLKEDSETTKIRPVFDASHKGVNNTSLNDELLVGPQLQNDMRSLVMRWRLKRIAFIADIQKMYRQILVSEADRDFQRIVWRNKPTDPMKEYRLLRVTFGTACAPYLAVKTLQQVANDEGDGYPVAADTIKEDFYIDDLLSGQDTVQEAINVAKEVKKIIGKGGFVLQKWASNNSEFLKGFPPAELSAHVNIDIKLDGLIKTLGLSWNMGDDVLKYTVQLLPSSDIITKRKILADVQKLFDPLGWLAPALIPAKIIIQKLWLQKVHWDEEISLEIKNEWLQIRQSFEDIKYIQIPRWLYTSNLKEVTIHGYCDASTKAYGAVAYVRVQRRNGDYHTGIIAARTKVAPVKSLSLPRLELCGAVLLSQLLKHISEAMRIPKSQIFCWTDSTIVLSWLNGDPNRWQTFVRNRVITILANIGNKWYHVQSQHNPADVASRGMLAAELKDYSLWWHGPENLKQKEIIMEELTDKDTDLEKIKINTYLTIEGNETISIYKHFEGFKNLSALLKTIMYAMRFLRLIKVYKNKIIDSPITTADLEESLQICIKITQDIIFHEDITDLKKGKKLKNKSRLKTLSPFLDSQMILRVGGRLSNSDLDRDYKHPILLDNKNSLTWLLVADAHKQTLHGGVQLMLNYLRSKYWILKAKGVVKRYIHKCTICAKLNARARTQLMGELPKVRVTPARAFLHSGIDFAGPYDVLMSKGRGAKTNKAYIAIFVCMSTKAIHLELVGDLTSEAFIGAFRRFVARRGRCSDLWSDQGRTFIGANKALAEAFKEANLEFGDYISNLLAHDGTQWHFIPAYSPNFGGLWESGVKSMKYHLRRIMDTHLTFEEMTTILCQVEACLNSRPLCPLDGSDVENCNVLTPGHFLIGESLITIPSPSLKDTTQSSLSRWQHCQKLLSNFWHRWQSEYLSRLQQRPKWLARKDEFDIGQIVLIKTENLPPGKWPLGRIVNKHPGPDGVTRVYSVKSGPNIVRRSITKLCLLPIDKDY